MNIKDYVGRVVEYFNHLGIKQLKDLKIRYFKDLIIKYFMIIVFKCIVGFVFEFLVKTLIDKENFFERHTSKCLNSTATRFGLQTVYRASPWE